MTKKTLAAPAIWRQVQKVGLVHDYKHNDEVKKNV